jgi:hypothetical protein
MFTLDLLKKMERISSDLASKIPGVKKSIGFDDAVYLNQ